MAAARQRKGEYRRYDLEDDKELHYPEPIMAHVRRFPYWQEEGIWPATQGRRVDFVDVKAKN